MTGSHSHKLKRHTRSKSRKHTKPKSRKHTHSPHPPHTQQPKPEKKKHNSHPSTLKKKKKHTTTKPPAKSPVVAQPRILKTIIAAGGGLPTVPICLTLAGSDAFRLGGRRVTREDVMDVVESLGVPRGNMHLSVPKTTACLIVVPDNVREEALPPAFWGKVYLTNPDAKVIRLADYLHHLTMFASPGD